MILIFSDIKKETLELFEHEIKL